MTDTHVAAHDVQAFAARVLRIELWPHQTEVLRSTARYRVVCAGRQVGKSVLLAITALHEATTRRNVTILLVSAGEVASRRLLAECAALATGSELLGGVLDESRSMLNLSNGSKILSVPASERQIRGWPVDLLIVDEAGFVGNEVWRAAEPAIIARPGSRVVLASSPWGGVDHFFRALWQRGMDAPDENVQSWHWPSTVSPLVDEALLAQIREREPADYFRREYLAEWADAAGSYFTEAELMAATADYALTSPEDVPTRPDGSPGYPAAAGVDWAATVDATAIVLTSLMGRSPDGRARLFLPWIESRTGWGFSEAIDRMCTIASRYRVRVIASERNGVGEYPTVDLRDRLRRRRIPTQVAPVWTDVRRKQAGFSQVKGLLQSDRLVLPLHPPLLKELRALTFEQQPGGTLRIAVPESAGHDDLALAAMQSVSCWAPSMLRDAPAPLGLDGPESYVSTGRGMLVPRRPLPDLDRVAAMRSPTGKDTGDGW